MCDCASPTGVLPPGNVPTATPAAQLASVSPLMHNIITALIVALVVRVVMR